MILQKTITKFGMKGASSGLAGSTFKGNNDHKK